MTQPNSGKQQASDNTDVCSMEGGMSVEGGVDGGRQDPTTPTSNGQAVRQQQRDGDAASNASVEEHIEIATFIKEENDERVVAREKRMVEKLVYVISVVTLVLLAYAVLAYHWILPYYYTVSMPTLILLRTVIYWKYKYQYFLLDFCYFGNIFCLIYIWAFPGQREVMYVMYGVANGPLAWAVVLFRNSAVFHDYDRMTSIYIHVLPMFITYSARWYPQSMSEYWYTAFTDDFTEDLGYMFIWLSAVPFAFFLLHAVMYIAMVYCICRPGPEYLHSFSYLSAKENKGCTGRCISCCGRNKTKIGKLISYSGISVTYGVLSLAVLPLFFKYFVLHTIYVACICVIVVFNGAGYYMDVFAKRGFVKA